jgi:hypothetical protein
MIRCAKRVATPGSLLAMLSVSGIVLSNVGRGDGPRFSEPISTGYKTGFCAEVGIVRRLAL